VATSCSLTPGFLHRRRPRAAVASPGAAFARPGSLLLRLERWLWQQRQRELEQILSGCLDTADVERVLRRLERVGPHYRYD
jgi:hypothetical protein